MIGIISDSECDIPAELIEKYAIIVIPQIVHGNVPDEAEQLAKRIHKEYSPSELLFYITGPVLGLNTGSGALALCGYLEEPHLHHLP